MTNPSPINMSSAIPPTLDQVQTRFQSGDLPGAEADCQDILKGEPDSVAVSVAIRHCPHEFTS